jgi:hypothetical protein
MKTTQTEYLSYDEELERYQEMQFRRSKSCKAERILRLVAKRPDATTEQIITYELFLIQHKKLYKEMEIAESRWASFQATQKSKETTEFMQAFVDALDGLSLQSTNAKQIENSQKQAMIRDKGSREIAIDGLRNMGMSEDEIELKLKELGFTNSSSAAGIDSDEAIERLQRRFSFSSDKDDPTLDLSEEL